MRVTHSRWRNGPSGSRMHADAALSLVAREHLLRCRRVDAWSVTITASTPGREVEGEVLLDDVALVARRAGSSRPSRRGT